MKNSITMDTTQQPPTPRATLVRQIQDSRQAVQSLEQAIIAAIALRNACQAQINLGNPHAQHARNVLQVSIATSQEKLAAKKLALADLQVHLNVSTNPVIC